MLEELEIMLPKASDSESDIESGDQATDEDKANSDNEGGAAASGEPSKPTKRKTAKGKK